MKSTNAYISRILSFNLIKSGKALVFIFIINLAFSCSSEKQDPRKVNNKPGELNYDLLKHENIGRGLIAVFLESGKKVYWGEGSFDNEKEKVYIGWRLLAKDPKGVGFNIYRQVDGGSETKLNDNPVTSSTNYIDGDVPKGDKFSYTLKTVIDGKEAETSKPYVFTRKDQPNPYLSIKMDSNFERIAIGDLDGDGENDIIIKYPGGNVDPWYLYWKKSPGTYKLTAHKKDGTSMWTYDMGWAIEQGAWYSPYLVYDLNSDGKCEVVVKSGENDPRDAEGKVTTGAEYVSILDGSTGKEITKADWIPREPFFQANKQHAYNYASRNQLAVAYLDGVHPYLLVLRGTYNLMMVRAYSFIDNQLKLAWDWDNTKLRDKKNNYWGQGGHTTFAADVDQDGKDEVILGSCVLDDNGKELWTTGLGHNDAAFVGDIIPERPGLEIYYNIEAAKPDGNGMCMVDARTGEVIWGADYPTNHVHGTGFCSDIDRVHPGRECYGVEIADFEGKRTNFGVVYSNKGEIVQQELMSTTTSAFWDTDSQRELVSKGEILEYKGNTTFNTKPEGRVIAVADIFGDWREEIITSLDGELRIYTTPILANTRFVCLMQDPIYRNYVAQASQGYYEIPMTTKDIPFRSEK